MCTALDAYRWRLSRTLGKPSRHTELCGFSTDRTAPHSGLKKRLRLPKRRLPCRCAPHRCRPAPCRPRNAGAMPQSMKERQVHFLSMASTPLSGRALAASFQAPARSLKHRSIALASTYDGDSAAEPLGALRATPHSGLRHPPARRRAPWRAERLRRRRTGAACTPARARRRGSVLPAIQPRYAAAAASPWCTLASAGRQPSRKKDAQAALRPAASCRDDKGGQRHSAMHPGLDTRLCAGRCPDKVGVRGQLERRTQSTGARRA